MFSFAEKAVENLFPLSASLFFRIGADIQNLLRFALAEFGNALQLAADSARARTDQLIQLAARLIESVLCLRQAGFKLVKLGLDRTQNALDLTRALLNRNRAERHLQAVQQRRHRARTGQIDMVVALQNLHHAAADSFGVQSLEGQEHDAEFGRMRRCKILVADVLRLAPERQNELLRAGVDLLARAALIGIAQRAVGVARELGVDRQPDRAAVLRRKANGELDNVAAAGHP